MTLSSWPRRLERAPDRSLWLAVFRVYLACHVLKHLVAGWPFLGVVFGPDTFAVYTKSDVLGFLPINLLQAQYPLLIWLCVLSAVCLAFGVGKNVAVAAVFLLTEILQRMNGYILNGGDNLLKFFLLYLVFADSFRHLAWRRTKPSSNPRKQLLINFFTNVSIGCILIHLALVYFISGIAKWHADAWYNGVALYYILLSDRFSATSWNPWLARNGVFVTLGTYSTMFWEIAFPFLVWFRSCRWILLSFGLLMHAGIFFLMMIHEFEVLFVMTYGFFFTDKEWRRFGAFSVRQPRRFLDFVRRMMGRVPGLVKPQISSLL